MDDTFLQEFKRPGSAYRGAPFWAWNGKLDPEELRKQIRLMHAMGLGGFFMHSRVGLDTAYLSDDWFNCVKACIDEAEKLDMQAWLYDEDRWPSGAAGGLVTKHPEYRLRTLVCRELSSVRDLKIADNTLATFVAVFDGDLIKDYRQVSVKKLPGKLMKNEKLLCYHIEMAKPDSWYNGYTYLDTLNHEAVKEFIRVTHEAYRREIGHTFGKRVPGIFTDEPNYGRINRFTSDKGAWGISWTGKLPDVFKKRYGYDLINHLPEISFDIKGLKVSRARYHYYDCISYLFADAFGRQIGEWCEKNHMQYTGHLLAEDTLRSQVEVVGNCMRFYEYMQAPGIDLLTEYRRLYNTAKQVSSAARQFGRKWRLSETYGCTGWDFPFTGHKALGDWQVALGINLRCQHLSWYTMLGQAKRDYPAGIFYQSPWWDAYAKVEDYFARILCVMTRGKEARDILVIHPVESMWTLLNRKAARNPEISRMDTDFIKLSAALLSQNLDFDFGDEELMSRHAKIIKKGRTGVLALGEAEYKAVVAPQMKTMRSSTLALLKKFKEAGGLVIFTGPAADHVDAVPSKEVVDFAKNCPCVGIHKSRLSKVLSPVARRISITGGEEKEIEPVLHLLREDRNYFYLFICNTGHNDARVTSGELVDIAVKDRKRAFKKVVIRGFNECTGYPLELDPDSGDIFKAEARNHKDGLEIETSLPAVGSRLFIIPKKKLRKAFPNKPAFKPVRKQSVSAKIYDISLSEDNVLALDYAEYKIGKGKWLKKTEVLKIDTAIRDKLGIGRRGGRMVQPWARSTLTDPAATRVLLKYTFDVRHVPVNPVYLALEKPEIFGISINDHHIDPDSECGWWVDRSLRKIPIDPVWLKKGGNELLLTCDYSENHSGFEMVYLLGHFGIQIKKQAATMTKAPTGLRIGNWVKQGLPFYSGSVSYRHQFTTALKKGEKLFLRIPEYRGAAVKIQVNDRYAGAIAWPPNELDVTPFINKGKNDLQIELISSRRNSHGPFHHSEKWPSWTGPGEFITKGDAWTDDYQLVPCGLMAAPELIVKKTFIGGDEL